MMIVVRSALSDVELTILSDRIVDRITDLSGRTKEDRLQSLWRALNFSGGDCRIDARRLKSFRGTTVADLCQHLDSHCYGPAERPFDEEANEDVSESDHHRANCFICRTYVNFVPRIIAEIEAEEY